ncbi:MAG: hypothetical protein ABRQ24_07765 [Syntrophomonadaceae bacterium]
MENEFLFEVVEEYFKVHNAGPRRWNFHTFWYWKNIPPKRLKQARKYFAPYDDRLEKPLLLMSDITFGKLFAGILITNIKLYYDLNSDEGKLLATPKRDVIKLLDIRCIDIQYFKRAGWLLVNGEKEACFASYSAGIVDENCATPFKNAVNHVLQALHEAKPDG